MTARPTVPGIVPSPGRRRLLAGAGAAWAGASLLGSRAVQAADYRALVVVFLNGGNDGHNCLVPTDAAYADYQRARTNLALPAASLTPLDGSSLGHRFGVHPALAPLAAMYNSRRLAFIANVGPLIVPTTAAQAMDQAVPLPPFLLSHFEQVAQQQGWGGDADGSGWGGRGLEALPASLRHPLAAASFDTTRTLVLGRRSPVSWISSAPDGVRYWGRADLMRPDSEATRALTLLSEGRSANAMQQQYTLSLAASLADAAEVTAAAARGPVPSGNFGNSGLADSLRTLARLMPAFKISGRRRQIFLVNWGSFDTHGVQRGSLPRTQDHQLGLAGPALAAFDAANRASGIDGDVVTLVMSEFGRTLRPASGGGSDHAWGNHWWLFGGPVAGGQVFGQWPSLVLNGPDDFDRDGGGRFVPTTATDQVAATLLSWLGVDQAALPEVLPNLANFARPTLGLLHG